MPRPRDPAPGTRSRKHQDVNNYLQVTKCELLGLSDLRTESETVRNTLAAYLNELSTTRPAPRRRPSSPAFSRGPIATSSTAVSATGPARARASPWDRGARTP